MTMRVLVFILFIGNTVALSAQCPDGPSSGNEVLTPTIRALLMLECPAALSIPEWEKVIENPDNWQALQIKIYEEETIDRCELPPASWYILLPGRRPPEKEPLIVRKDEQ